MLCCLGLFGGFAVGSVLGGPWSFIGPVIGFGLGLIGDMKLMGHGLHQTSEKTEPRVPTEEHERELS